MPDATSSDAFATLIQDGRKRRGWSQEDLEAASGVSRSTISRWERGIAGNPEPDHVRAVCAALGIDPRQAAVALGFLDAKDLEANPEELLDPLVKEALDALLDISIPRAAKEEWIAYLRYLQQRHNRPSNAS